MKRISSTSNRRHTIGSALPTEITSVSPATDTTRPAVNVHTRIEYNSDIESVLSVSGVLRAEDGSILSSLVELPLKTRSDERIDVRAHSVFGDFRPSPIMVERVFRAELDPLSLEHLENLREKNSYGRVVIDLDLFVVFLAIEAQIGNYTEEDVTIPNVSPPRTIRVIRVERQKPQLGNPEPPIIVQRNNFIAIRRINMPLHYEIDGGRWIKDFKPALGLGSYVMMEIPELVPVVQKSGDEFVERLASASRRLKEIQEKLRQGEWDEVAEECRGVYEDLTKGIQDKEAFKQNIERGLRENNHISDEGISAFQNLIKEVGAFSHEFHHYRDPRGNLTGAIAHKEDAYALYITLVGIVNLLVRKYQKSSQKL